jgi:hypothetical protein
MDYQNRTRGTAHNFRRVAPVDEVFEATWAMSRDYQEIDAHFFGDSRDLFPWIHGGSDQPDDVIRYASKPV